MDTRLHDYPSILNRQFKSINNRCIDIRSQFRIMQWNGLAKRLCQNTKYCRAPSKIFDWDEFRIWRVLEELVRYNCDIICIEEADFYEDIKPYLHNLG